MHIQYLKDNSGNKTSVIIPLEEWEKFQVQFKKLQGKQETPKSKNGIHKEKKHPKAGCMKGTFILSPDFDEPLEDFKEYME
ncbi:MAG: DUF2281 domain-containing protein [Ignavibacteria bacterium]|nr:DUF2281 domain-containing protein [Ignavibacteria bacterium]